MKISFDFDGTLTEPQIQKICKKFAKLGAEIFITTSRAEKALCGVELDNSDLFQLADKLHIDRKNITFTSYEDKYAFTKNFDMHFDDDAEEIFLINSFPTTHCIGVLFEQNMQTF